MQFPQDNIPINKSTYLTGVFLILLLIIGGFVFVTIQKGIAKKSYEKGEPKNEKTKEISNQPQGDSDKSLSTDQEEIENSNNNYSNIECNQISQENFIQRRFTNIGRQILKLEMIKKNDNCIYYWYVVSMDNIGNVQECSIFTILSPKTGKVEIFGRPQCQTIR
ncbi:MAG: hypothetical protein ACO1NK_07940 [Sediminibacterium sp.]